VNGCELFLSSLIYVSAKSEKPAIKTFLALPFRWRDLQIGLLLVSGTMNIS